MRSLLLTLALAASLLVPSAGWAQHYSQPATQYGQITSQQATTQLTPSQILQRLKSANNIPSQMASQIRLVKSPSYNAATDGKTIVVTDSLWNALGNNDARAFVISHELSHIVLSHVQKTTARRVGISAVDRYVLGRFVEQGTLWDLVGDVGLGLLDRKFSRNVEYQADDFGIRLMTRAGFEPLGSIQAFNTLQAASRSGPPEFLRDHPLTESRIRTLAQKYHLAWK